MLERKITAEEISELSGIGRRTLSRWVKTVDEEGFGALKGKDNISYSGFVIPSTGQLFTCKPEWFNYETTISMLV